jgi:hypothetical protein
VRGLRTLELYETSYAAGRRKVEAEHARRQAAALARERFVGRSAMLLIRTSALTCAVTGVLSLVRPQSCPQSRSLIAADELPLMTFDCLPRQVRPQWVASARASIEGLLGNPQWVMHAALGALNVFAKRARGLLLFGLALPARLKAAKA